MNDCVICWQKFGIDFYVFDGHKSYDSQKIVSLILWSSVIDVWKIAS